MRLPADRMFRRLVASVSFLLPAIACALAVLPLSDAQDSKVAPHSTSLIQAVPLTFERYEDQFVSRTSGYTVFLEPQQVTIALRAAADQAKTNHPTLTEHATGRPLRMRLLHSNPVSIGSPEEPLLAKASYFMGNSPARWRTNVPLFGRVRFPSVYKNVDLVYYGNQQQLEYDFVVQPGGEPQAIRFSIGGASRTEIVPGGDLILHVDGSQAILHRPLAYQIIDGQRRNVDASFLPLGGSRFGILVTRYDRKSPLIIDPVLAYSTYLGGSDDEGIFGIGFDDDGNIYVAGETSSLNFPQKGGVQDHLGGDYDAFVSKFDPTGDRLIYSTYLGGTKYDHAVGIRVDKHGRAYLAGITQSSDFPVKNAWQPALAGSANGFVARLSPSGSELEFSTYFGGVGFDQILALTIDRDEAIYVAGSTTSIDFPVTSAAFQRICDQGAFPGVCIGDAFVAKFDASGSKLIYSTYLGGNSYDLAEGLAVNERGEAYVVGETGSSNFPIRNPYQSSRLGFANAFVTRLNETGSDLVSSTYLGGTDFDNATDVALDRRGNIYLTGTTSSTDFPLSHPFQPTYGGGFFDGFVTKFNPEAAQLIYSTYYGGSGLDYPFRIAVNRHEQAALIGFTSSTNFPIYRALESNYSGGAADAFVVLLDRDGQQPNFSTYLGGTGDQYGYAVTIGCRDSVWVGGSTSSTDFPLARAFQPKYAGGPFDAFLSQILNRDDRGENSADIFDNGHGREEHDCRHNDE